MPIERLKGGRADELPYDQFDPEQLAMGIEVELEHTDDTGIATEIDMDHLEEIENYYTLLAEMEEATGVHHH